MEWQALEDDSAASEMISYSYTEHSQSLVKGLSNLRDEARFCDVILRIDGKTFPAHRCVLATFSPYFQAMFTSELKETHDREVTLKDIEPAILESLLEFFYTGIIAITQANVQSLMSASNLLQVLSVKDACSIFMAKHMDASNCLGIQCFAEAMNCETLQETAKDFALSNLTDMADHEEFLNLPRAKLMELVSSDSLDVPREEDVFMAVLKWFNHQPEARKDNFHKVLECCRLPLMSPHFIHNSVSKGEIVRTSLECFILLEEALAYHLLPDQRGDMQSVRTRPRRSKKTVDVIVCTGGLNVDGESPLRCLQAFDQTSNQWTSLCDLPFAVSDHGVVVTGQNMYVAGGKIDNNISSNRLLKFDPQTNKWEEMASLSCARFAHGMAMLGGFLYVVGGCDNTGSLDSVERYNIETNQWEQLPVMQRAVSYVTVIAHNGYLYMAGGENRGQKIGCLQRFDPRTCVWADMAPMLTPRSGSAGCVLDGKLYIIGGIEQTAAITKVEYYDVHNNQWVACSPMRGGRDCQGVAVTGGHIYVLGGSYGGRSTRSVERYTPATGRWEDVAEMTMPLPCSGLACTVLKVPKSLLASGNQ